MTPQEAKALFEDDLKGGKCYDECPECNARELAIKALEKQIPKKAMEIGINDKCLICGRWVNTNYKYCPECGQALDWSDTE